MNFQKSISQYLESEEYDKDSVSNSSVDECDSIMNDPKNSSNNYGDILNNLPHINTNIYEANQDCGDDVFCDSSVNSDDDSVSEYIGDDNISFKY